MKKTGTPDYFEGIRERKELSERWRNLAMQHHPDKGGDEATMQVINAQYQAAIEWLENGNVLPVIVAKPKPAAKSPPKKKKRKVQPSPAKPSAQTRQHEEKIEAYKSTMVDNVVDLFNNMIRFAGENVKRRMNEPR